MRAPKRGADYHIYYEGYLADCAYCDAQFHSERMKAVEVQIAIHVREEHPKVLEKEDV